MVLHALFFVPQVKEFIASYRPPVQDIEGPVHVARPPTEGKGAVPLLSRRASSEQVSQNTWCGRSLRRLSIWNCLG